MQKNHKTLLKDINNLNKLNYMQRLKDPEICRGVNSPTKQCENSMQFQLNFPHIILMELDKLILRLI